MCEYLIGIDVGGTNIKIMIMTSIFEVLDWVVIPTNKDLGYEIIKDNIIQAIQNIFIEHGINDPNVTAVGMGLPGVVDKKENQSLRLAYIEWDGFNPCEKIGDYFNAPSFIDNDASLNAFGEYKFGIKERFRNIVLITLGTGVGCGVIIDGKIFRGSRNLGAELGHLIVEVENAERCIFCGTRGCLEAYCSGIAMQRDAMRRMPSYPNSILHRLVSDNDGKFDNAFITQGVECDDLLSKAVLNRFIKYLSVGVSNVMKILNPELVLIGGGFQTRVIYCSNL